MTKEVLKAVSDASSEHHVWKSSYTRLLEQDVKLRAEARKPLGKEAVDEQNTFTLPRITDPDRFSIDLMLQDLGVPIIAQHISEASVFPDVKHTTDLPHVQLELYQVNYPRITMSIPNIALGRLTAEKRRSESLQSPEPSKRPCGDPEVQLPTVAPVHTYTTTTPHEPFEVSGRTTLPDSIHEAFLLACENVREILTNLIKNRRLNKDAVI